MQLEIIRDLCEKRAGGLRKLAADIGMSEANLHRCINKNKIQAAELEKISILLGVDIRLFFDTAALKNDSATPTHKINDSAVLQLCKLIVQNFQQRDEIIKQLSSIIK